MPQYAIMRFAKQKGGAGALEAHHERTKAKYASNPDIDTTRSKYNFHIVAPQAHYRQEVDSRIETAGCRTRNHTCQGHLCPQRHHFQKAKSLSDELLLYAATIEDENHRSKYMAYCLKWQRRIYRETILKEAQSIYPIKMDEFDTDIYAFNCSNGTLHIPH